MSATNLRTTRPRGRSWWASWFPAAEADAVAHKALQVLFVCTANICRSPYMELRARALTTGDEGVSFGSAGTSGFDQHPVDTTMASVLNERGVPVELTDAFASRALTTRLVAQADLVLTAEASHRAYVLKAVPGARRKTFTLGQFAESVARLDEPALCGVALVMAVRRRRAGVSPAHDIRDPYRRGKAAGERAADVIDDLLRAVLPQLSATPRPPA